MFAMDEAYIPHQPGKVVGISVIPADLPVEWAMDRPSVLHSNLIDPRNSREVRAAAAQIGMVDNGTARDFMAAQWAYAMADNS